MSASLPEYQRSAIRPVECLKSGWSLIKGQYWLFLGIALVGVLIGSAVPMAILLGPMMCGIYLSFFRRLRGEPVSFEVLFKGFDFFGESVIATLIQMVPMMALLMPLYVVFIIGMMRLAPETRSGRTVSDPSALLTFLGIMAVVFIVVFLIVLAISALFIFTYPLIIDRKLSGFNAVKTSVQAVFANLGGTLGLMMLNLLLGIVGMLFCYVGAVFVLPISLAAWAVAYRQVFPDETSATVS